jgi:hypothetical protein
MLFAGAEAGCKRSLDGRRCRRRFGEARRPTLALSAAADCLALPSFSATLVGGVLLILRCRLRIGDLLPSYSLSAGAVALGVFGWAQGKFLDQQIEFRSGSGWSSKCRRIFRSISAVCSSSVAMTSRIEAITTAASDDCAYTDCCARVFLRWSECRISACSTRISGKGATSAGRLSIRRVFVPRSSISVTCLTQSYKIVSR